MEIRPDIKAIDVVKLTDAGRCMLSAYTPGTIAEVLSDLKVVITQRDMNNLKRWNFLSFGCRDKAKENGISPNYAHAKELLTHFGFTYDDEPCEKSSPQEKKQARTYTKEQWNDCPSDRRDYANRANGYEEGRAPGDSSRNPFFTWLYPSWKVRMFQKYPYLKEIHTQEWTFCKGFPPTKINGTDDMDAYQCVERICQNLAVESVAMDGFTLTPEMKQRAACKDPWFDTIGADNQAQILTKYPFYANIVGRGNHESFFKKLHDSIYDKSSNATNTNESKGQSESEDDGLLQG